MPTTLSTRKYVFNGREFINGEISLSDLTDVGNRERLLPPAAESFKRLIAEAIKAGFTKYVLEDGYRACGQPGDGEKYLRNEVEFTQWAAWELYQSKLKNPTDEKYQKYNKASDPTNGCKSFHGFGLAIDIYGYPKKSREFYKGDVDKGIPIKQDEFQIWLTSNGSKHGWIWEGEKVNEPWHFEYFYDKDLFKSIDNQNPLASTTPPKKNPLKPISEFDKNGNIVLLTQRQQAGLIGNTNIFRQTISYPKTGNSGRGRAIVN